VLARREARQGADIIEAVEAADHLPQFAGPCQSDDRPGQGIEFGGEPLALACDVGTLARLAAA